MFDSSVEEQAVITGYRLSPRQKELWPLARAGAAYVAQLAVRIEGELDAALLKAAFGDVVRRHESLRTTFHSPAGLRFPLQVVAEEHVYTSEVLDAESQTAEEICVQQRGLPFDFDRGPLVRAVIVSGAVDHTLLIVTASALCADAPTLHLLFDELCVCYKARARSSELNDAPLQYIEFSEWQNELLEADESITRSRAVSEPPTLPFEQKVSGEATPEVDVVKQSFGTDITTSLAQISDAPTFMLACWQILLWRLTGREDITIGRVFDGRRFEELRGVFGLCSRRVPVSCRLLSGLTLRDVLEHTRTAVELAHGSEEVLTPEQETALPAGFDFNQWPAARTIDGLTFSVAETFARHDRYKLELSCAADSDRLFVEFRYDSSLFRREAVEYLAAQFEALVEHAVAEPDIDVSDLRVLTKAQTRWLVEDFNHTETAFPADQCLHQLFEQQAERTPGNIALEADNLRLTYAELNTRANGLAHHLRSLGVRPGDVVGICLRRTPEMVVSLLGVLKAGAAYVPLDPSHPEQRLAFIVEETRVKVVLTLEKLHREALGAHVLLLDSEAVNIEQHDAENPANVTSPEDLAYVLYTSGSTGNPKGVMIPHRGLVNYLSWAIDCYDASGVPTVLAPGATGTILYSQGVTAIPAYTSTSLVWDAANSRLKALSGLAHKRTTVADTNYTGLVSDYIIAYTSLTAGRTVTLPLGVAGQAWVVKDEAGGATANNITVQMASGNIDGAANKVINANYGVLRIYSDGTNAFTW